ncbi:unnamed protein product [Arctogadus glacialis]
MKAGMTYCLACDAAGMAPVAAPTHLWMMLPCQGLLAGLPLKGIRDEAVGGTVEQETHSNTATRTKARRRYLAEPVQWPLAANMPALPACLRGPLRVKSERRHGDVEQRRIASTGPGAAL